MKDLENRIFHIKQSNFNSCCLDVFNFQYQNNAVYREYCELIHVSASSIRSWKDIPFLPISAFKSHQVKTGSWKEEVLFSSSGTTGQASSKHFVKSSGLYSESFTKAFELFYGKAQDMCILALLPSYLERSGSSLIYMVEELMEKSGHPKNGFFLYNQEDLYQRLQELKKLGQKTLLIGVSFALLDFVAQFSLPDFPELTLMETGGMKGRGKELTRSELHDKIGNNGKKPIHSEYGMTELLSQAYSKSLGLFDCPPWMKIHIRQQDDPFSRAKTGELGGINVIDLANLYSCSFIQTDDLGRLHEDGKFEVLGRFDQSEVRGCNLLIA